MVTTRTQEQLKEVVEAWKLGRMEHLLITGVAGTGKTYTATQTDPEAKLVPSSSPFELYKQLAYINGLGVKRIIIDDMDINLFKGGRGADLLKQLLCSGKREVAWKSSRTGRQAGVPDHFETEMKVCIITNYMSKSNEHVRAIVDRCFEAQHLPSGEEVYTLCKKHKIVSAGFIDKLKEIAPNPLYLSIRKVEKLYQTYKIGLAWEDDFKQYLREMVGIR